MCLAVPGRILAIEGDDALTRMARVSFGGIVKPVSLACLPEAAVGDYVLVHVGVALSVIDEREAEDVFRQLDAIAQSADAAPSPPAPA